ncbi:MAG TPA: protein kinase [Burkholderiales bacterium]
MRLILDIGLHDNAPPSGRDQGKTLHADAPAAGGALLACFAPVPTRPAGAEGVQAAAAALRDVYAASSEALAPARALEEALAAANRAVRRGESAGGTAFAAIALHGRRWIGANAGNVRIWRCRDGELRQLSRDHTVPRPLGRTEITHALGYEAAVRAEHVDGDLREGDVYAVTSAGVHDALSGSMLLGVLDSGAPAQQQAEQLVQRARAAGGSGYLGACIARVEALPAADRAHAHDGALPLAPLPGAGDTVDDFVVERLLLKSRLFRLYRARDRASGEAVILRFPDPDHPESAAALLREQWVSGQLDSPHLLKPVPARAGRRSVLYTPLAYRPVRRLAKRIRRKGGLGLRETLRFADQLLEVLEALHARGLVHGDLRTGLLLYETRPRSLCIAAVASSGGGPALEASPSDRAQRLSYWAPERFADEAPSVRSDIYAAGVTIYRMLSARYPYGRIRSPDDWRTPRSYAPLARIKEGLPEGIDRVLARACARDATERYATAREFAEALRAAARELPAGAAREPTQASPFWSWCLAAGLAGGLALYLYLTLR